MKLLIIGHSVKDIIHSGDRGNVSPGGIYYSVLGALSCNDKENEIHLITSIDDMNRNLYANVYDAINSENVIIRDKIPVVHLKIFDNAERCEFYENITDKLSLEAIKDYNQFDGILINMITGFDITIDDLLDIRSNYKGLIYLDVHTLSRGIDENNQRIFRLVPDVEKWISSVDIIQVNEHELFTLSSERNELDIIKQMLMQGPKYLILTKGEKGVRVFWLNNGELCSLFYPAIKIETKNKVGCGDIFGSVFFYSYIKNNDLKSSLKKANTAAGCAAGYSDITEFHNLRNDTLSRLN